MTDWNNYSMQKPVPFGPIVQPPASPTPSNVPSSGSQQTGGPFGFLSSLFGQMGGPFGGMGGMQANPLGGLLGSLFNPKKTEPAAPKTVIDKRPDDVQRLVSMFSNPSGGQ